uniref:Uncharacterized protein n=1 Tax=Arundo donax TaxID=35708 RepID=A0A0A9APU3_ARUDO
MELHFLILFPWITHKY